MKELNGVDLFDVDCDVVCITTNGFVKANGEAVMGRGCAYELAQLFPRVPRILGAMIKQHGNIVQQIMMANDTIAVAFPVKHARDVFDGSNVVAHATGNYRMGQLVPGFHLKADIELIKQSAIQLRDWVEIRGFKSVVLPRAGCGAGELDWATVKPILDAILDDRFTAVTK
jgi:hypothetical protein